jgi:transposase
MKSSKPTNLDEAIVLINQLYAMNLELMAQQSKLKDQLAWFQKQIFGQKSEKLFPATTNAPDLFAEMLETGNEPQSKTISIAAHERKTKGHGRQEIDLDDFPNETVVLDVTDEEKNCPDCGQPMQECGREESRKLCRRTEFYVKRYLRIKRACKQHPECGVVIAPVAPAFIEKGIVDESVIARVVTDKYEDNIPIRRQEKRFAREGVHLSASTIIGMLDPLAKSLESMLDYAKVMMLQSDILYSDDTNIPVVGDVKGKTKKGCMWTWSDGERYVIFDYSPTRKRAGPESFLGQWRGYLHSDAYAGYNSVHANGVVPVYCWAHARRKFFEAHKAGNRKAERPLQIIGRMFSVERMLRANENMSSERAQAWRTRVSTKCENQLYSWCRKNEISVLPASKLGQAMSYYKNQRNGLQTYLNNIRLNIDNNLSERNLRTLVIGRKNWLFAGNEEGANRAAIFYSVIATCKIQGIKTTEYLEKFMRAIATNRNALPENLLPGIL